jgi:hypothetical protein
VTYLILQSAGSQVTEWEFEASGGPVHEHLKGDHGIGVSRRRRRHDLKMLENLLLVFCLSVVSLEGMREGIQGIIGREDGMRGGCARLSRARIVLRFSR